MRITRLLLLWAMLAVGIAMATTGAIPADAGRCDLWNSSITVVNDGDCYYTNDTVGPIVVTTMTGGTINGGSGSDSVGTQSGGTFQGGGGNDVVGYMDGGTFNGGPGGDRVTGNMFDASATFNGGAGADAVTYYCSGTVWSATYDVNTCL